MAGYNPMYGSNKQDKAGTSCAIWTTSANLNGTGVKGTVMSPINGKVVGVGVVSNGDPGAAANKINIAVNGGTNSTAGCNIKNGDADAAATSATKFVEITDNNTVKEGDLVQLNVSVATSNAVTGDFVIVFAPYQS